MLFRSIIESQSLRQTLCTEENTAILERVGSLIDLPKSGFATTEQLAEFYQVSIMAIKHIAQRHCDELEKDGYHVLPANKLRENNFESLHYKSRFVAIFPRRAILRVGMLLVESKVAKQIRHYLLSTEEHSLSLSNHRSLMQMAERLEEHAIKIAENARQSSENADQLISQANLLKAMIQEIYHDRDEIQKVRKKVESLELRFSLWENSPVPTTAKEYISEGQVEILKKKVSQKTDNPISIWKKFNKRFGITRYKFLPADQFQNALRWLEKECMQIGRASCRERV